jgi:voltage-gated potassium channel
VFHKQLSFVLLLAFYLYLVMGKNSKLIISEKEAEGKYLHKKPILPAIILLSVIILGTTGFYILWLDTNATLIDALYMTLITITTIGFAEVFPLDNTGRIFTIIIGIGGIGSLFYLLSIFMENLFILQIKNYKGKKKIMKRVNDLSDHLIIVGYGRVGKLAVNEIARHEKKCIIIDENFEDDINYTHNENIFTLKGDATRDEILLKAGIDRAQSMIVTTAKSATTVFVVLTARVLNPKLFIVARVDDDNDQEKMIRAGADKVVNPYSIGGQRLANLVVNPNVIDFFETSFGPSETNLSIEKILLPGNSKWVDKTLIEIDFRRKVGVTILAVIRNGKPLVNPDGNFRLRSEDQLIAMGTKQDLANIEKLMTEM